LRLRVFDTLLEQRRYAEINAAFDVTSDAQREFERFERYRQAANQMSSEQQASMRLGQLRTLTTQNVARCYEILLGVERTQDAAALAGRLLEFDKSADTYAALAAAAARAGKCTSEHLDYVRQALDLSGGNDPKIIGLAAQVYAQLGRRGEAIDLISGKLDAVKSEEGKRLLRGLLESLKAAPALTTQKGE
jgi:tetratricopeptide (TPR) repeat protein